MVKRSIIICICCFFLCGCQSEYERGYEDAEQEMQEKIIEAWESGYSEGLRDASYDYDLWDGSYYQEEAFDNGYDEGYREGWDDAYDSAWNNGYDFGYWDGKSGSEYAGTG